MAVEEVAVERADEHAAGGQRGHAEGDLTVKADAEGTA